MSIKELYKVLTLKETNNVKTNTIYDSRTGEVSSVDGGKVRGVPCASPINFNRRIKRSILNKNEN